MVKVNPHDVESATDVSPFGWADYAFIAETENFAACQNIYPTCLGTAYLRIGLPKGPLVLVWISIGDVVIEENTSILHFSREQQPLLGMNRYIHTEAVQQVKIVCIGVANTYRTLETTTILAANVKPMR